VARPAGWQAALDKALGAVDLENTRKYTEDAVRFVHDNAMTLYLNAYGTPYVSQKYVHDLGYYTTGSIYKWTPEKTWLSK